jgi:hypothetical protein
MNSFYNQPEESIDVLFLGASGLHWGVSPLTIWDAIGRTSFVRANAGQQASMIYYYLIESLNYQKPKVVVLDAYRLVRYYSLDENESSYRRSFEPMKMSFVKMKSFFDFTQDSNLEMSISILFPLLRYHTRWNDLERADFKIFMTAEDIFRGQTLSFDKFPVVLPEDYMAEIKNQARLKEESQYYYEKILEICKENQIDIVLLAMPRLSNADYGEYLAVKAFADKHNLMFIDYNLPDLMSEVGFDPNIDMVDEGHLNSCGAEKFSKHLALILQNHFDLPDRRQEGIAEQWNIDAETLLSQSAEYCH